MFPCARFDDLTAGGERSFALRGLQEEVIARSVDEVVPALERVRELTRRGLWAGGYVGYEAAPAFDSSLRVRSRLLGDPFHQLPVVWFGLYKRREELPALEPRQVHPAPYSVSAWTPTTNQAQYDEAIERIRVHIADGETYQVNHTFRLRAAFSGDPYELYRDLMLAQRGAYGACFDAGRYRIVSASPERFFRINDGRIEVRPMKGTIRRGRWPEEDEQMGIQLLASEKDRAENLMIVDLLRNDLGRIAEFGSVSVDHLVQLERYETVWQLTSQISADLHDADLVDVFRALFPSGSVTGAPKASTMAIIAGLEHTPRGVYCGAVGYVAPPGSEGPDADFNVAIRTVVVDQDEGLAEYGVGGGITWDSVSTAEYEEARLKSALLVERRPDFDLFETIRWDDARGFWWLDEHLERVGKSAAYFGYRFDEHHAREALEAAVRNERGARVVRLIASRNGVVEVHVTDEQLEPLDTGGPMRVAIDTARVSRHNVFLFHKTTRRIRYDEAAVRRPDVDDVILVNEDDEVTESTIGNVAVRFGDAWFTPPLDSGLLGGVHRRVLLDKGTITERVITLDDVREADEVAVINSVRGWRQATIVD
ncbi:MAG: aminodeoxychorismate synthase component I [Acidimicrobiia bacterium]|nr:aminodeoxychorismate synthase component I [Acidimicrobiia bacterium]